MSYLRVKNWDRYQNADVFKKSGGRPPWCKLFTRRDIHLDEAPLEARLLFWELLRVASEYANEMRSDPEWIARETRMPRQAVVKGLPVLLKGGWLSETKTLRRSRKIRDKLATREEKEVDEDKDLVPTAPPGPPAGRPPTLRVVGDLCPECELGGGAHTIDCSLRRRTA